MPDLFKDLFTPNFAAAIDPKDRPKAEALLAVVCKSTASLADVAALADALDLQLSISEASKPKEA